MDNMPKKSTSKGKVKKVKAHKHKWQRICNGDGLCECGAKLIEPMPKETTEWRVEIKQRVERYGMAYKGIIDDASIEKSMIHWQNELLDVAEMVESAALKKGREEGLKIAFGVLPTQSTYSLEDEEIYAVGFNTALSQSKEAINRKLIENV